VISVRVLEAVSSVLEGKQIRHVFAGCDFRSVISQLGEKSRPKTRTYRMCACVLRVIISGCIRS
jgi:hypothetical protein